MRKTYRLSSWRSWDKFVDSCVKDFQSEFHVQPSLLVANTVTLRRMSIAADKTKVSSKKNRVSNRPTPSSYVQLSGLAHRDYTLFFAEEDEVSDNCFSLVYVLSEDEKNSLASE